MTITKHRLKFGVPPPFPFEAPSSWLSRLAFAQGLGSLDELASFLDLQLGIDLDWHLRGEALQTLRQRCGLSPSSFAIAHRVMGGAAASGVSPHRLLLIDKAGAARFRCCPGCIAERRVAYFDIHWRFQAWRACPVHHCLLIDACPSCASALIHPMHMESTAASRAGHASLGRCPRCASQLGAAAVRTSATEEIARLGKREKARLANGRALLAALFQRQFALRGEVRTVEDLKNFYSRGLFPVADQNDLIDQKLRAWRTVQAFTTDLETYEHLSNGIATDGPWRSP